MEIDDNGIIFYIYQVDKIKKLDNIRYWKGYN